MCIAGARKSQTVAGSGGTSGGYLADMGISEGRAMGAGFGPKRKAARLPIMPLLGLGEQPVA